MLKLIKYEFRRSRTSLMAMLGAAFALYLAAPLGAMMERDGLMSISMFGLMFYCFAAYVYVLIRGVSAYSGELSTRSGYLMLMAPRSTLSIVLSKLLFTLCFAIVMLAVCALACIGSAAIFMDEVFDVRGLIPMLKYVALNMEIDLSALGFFCLYAVVSVLISVISIVSMGYLAATLSAAIAARGKGAKLLSVALFIVLLILVGKVSTMAAPDAAVQNFTDLRIALSAAIPTLLVNLGFTALFTGLSALILKKRVCL